MPAADACCVPGMCATKGGLTLCLKRILVSTAAQFTLRQVSFSRRCSVRRKMLLEKLWCCCRCCKSCTCKTGHPHVPSVAGFEEHCQAALSGSARRVILSMIAERSSQAKAHCAATCVSASHVLATVTMPAASRTTGASAEHCNGVKKPPSTVVSSIQDCASNFLCVRISMLQSMRFKAAVHLACARCNKYCCSLQCTQQRRRRGSLRGSVAAPSMRLQWMRAHRLLPPAPLTAWFESSMPVQAPRSVLIAANVRILRPLHIP